MTTDHSLVQELIDAGAIDRQHAFAHPQSHVITRALGVEPNIRIDTVSFPIQTGDVLLLCSDGLSRALDPFAVENLHCIDGSAADSMLDRALHLDGSDNISLVLVNIGCARDGASG